jgi:hypothetical protein
MALGALQKFNSLGVSLRLFGELGLAPVTIGHPEAARQARWRVAIRRSCNAFNHPNMDPRTTNVDPDIRIVAQAIELPRLVSVVNGNAAPGIPALFPVPSDNKMMLRGAFFGAVFSVHFVVLSASPPSPAPGGEATAPLSFISMAFSPIQPIRVGLAV